MNFFRFVFTVVFLLPGIAPPATARNAAARHEPAFLKEAALKIDRHIAAFYRKQGLPVPEVTDDATFLRRAFLVAAGRIPSVEEAVAFFEIDEEDKRGQLIAHLLDSKGYDSHMTNWAFDLLRMRDDVEGNDSNFEPYRDWVKRAVEDNMPWDEMVTRLVASSGDGWHPETAAVGYYTRDRGMPLDNLSNSMRVFLGTRMECAQCHDDPFGNRTERYQFYELAAFTHGQGMLGRQHMTELYRELQDGEKFQQPEWYIAKILWDDVYNLSLSGGGSGNIPLPADYQYRDGTPGEVIGAKTPFGRTVRMSARAGRDNGRGQMADWIVSRTDGQFASVIANRMWRRVMGKGIYEPVDDYIPAENTHYPELVAHLSRLMVDLKYDLKAFQHVLLLTRTFQFGTNPKPSTVAEGDDFHGRKIERLSAEQIWDSLITLSDGNPDNLPRRSLDDRVKLRGRPVLVGMKTMPQISREVLALGSDREVRAYYDNLVKEILGDGSDDPADAGGHTMMSMGMMKEYQTFNKDSKVRASELPSPAPADHFLFTFGQSDREVVDASTKEPNIGQVLSLMNGFVQNHLVNRPEAHLYRGLEGVKSDEDKIRRLYIAILSRPPSEEEMEWMTEEVKERGEAGYRNIVSALVMSSEFLFLQ